VWSGDVERLGRNAPEGKFAFPERSRTENAMKKTTSPREKTHFSLGDGFFLL